MTTDNRGNDKKLIDEFNREITYLRVSLTNRCNLRCVYCYGSVADSFQGKAPLGDEQLIRLIRIFASLGVKKIRFTGGEPLVRLRIADLVRKTAQTEGISLIGITTNGLILKPLLPDLTAAGLNRINISLDTLDKGKFVEITGLNGFDRVYEGIMSAVAGGQFPIVKVNTVVIRGINDDEIQNLAEWALAHPIDLRFIEFMPTAGSQWGPDRFISEQEMRTRINFKLHPLPNGDIIGGPAKSYEVPGKPGRLSFISAVSHNFCPGCNRLRLTADGDIFGCLFGAEGVNMGKLLDQYENDEELVSFLVSLVSKPGFRRCVSPFTVIEPQPCMRKVGG
jgi:cyclic pyranopterin phosphate synthase